MNSTILSASPKMNQLNKEQSSLEPTVIWILGNSGVGKSHLLERFAKENPGSLQFFAPRFNDVLFDSAIADFQNHAAVVIDDVPLWEGKTLASGVCALEQHALANSKKIILVAQSIDDIIEARIQLVTKPLIIQLNGRCDSLNLIFDGRSLLMQSRLKDDDMSVAAQPR